MAGGAQPREPNRLLVDPRRLRSLWFARLTRATDWYLRSAPFLQSMRLGLGALTGAQLMQQRAAKLLFRHVLAHPEARTRRGA